MAKGPRSIHKLSPLKVAKAGPGKYGDGGGLWLFKDHKDAGRWVYRYTFRGESHELGLGSIWTINADEAREEARLCRKLQKEGKDLRRRLCGGNRPPATSLDAYQGTPLPHPRRQL